MGNADGTYSDHMSQTKARIWMLPVTGLASQLARNFADLSHTGRADRMTHSQ